MQILKLLLIASCIALLSNCTTPSDTTDPAHEKATALAQLVQSIDTNQQFNGVIAVQLKGQKPIYYVNGYRNPITKDTPLTPKDRFHIASLSKSFTAIAVLKLMEEYGLQPDDSIGPYFTELSPAMQNVTIAQLANHTNGIHDYLSLTNDHHGLTNQDAIQLLVPIDSTVFVPGSNWGYSNSGYVLLAELIERVSGQSFASYLEQKVLQPYGMTQTQLRPEPTTYLNGFMEQQQNTVFLQTLGGSGIVTNVDDLLTYAQHHKALKKYADQAQQYSSPWRDPKWRYGFGFYFSKDTLGAFRAHSGKTEGFLSYMRINTDGQYVVVILMNQWNHLLNPIRDGIVEWLATDSSTTTTSLNRQ